MPATIAANVAQTETDIDYARVADCIERAGLTQKISSLPNGVESLLNRDIYEDAVDLSGRRNAAPYAGTRPLQRFARDIA